ncbi:hypothetical protein ACE1SV_52540 [Streptomyces sennicomposti]
MRVRAARTAPPTQVPAPRPLRRYPSAVSCSYASVTSPRETRRSAARSRLEGSRVPGASRPERTASRKAAWSERPRARAGADAAGSSSSQAAAPCRPCALVPDDVMEVDLKPGRRAP